MRVGDLVAVYHHVPRHEAGNVPVGLIGKGIVIEINKPPDGHPLVTYFSSMGKIEYAEPGFHGSIVVTIKVVNNC